MYRKVPVSVLIITKNEELNIRECLESVSWASEIVIVDSQSTDRTVEIAQKYTAKIHQYTWNSKQPKRSWALSSIPLENEWVLMIDADERATPDFAEALRTIVTSSHNSYDGYAILYNYWFLGKYLRFGDPVRKLVLYKHAKTHFEQCQAFEFDEIKCLSIETAHELPVVSGKVGLFPERLAHKDSRPLFFYFDRHNKYSTWEAALLYRKTYAIANNGDIHGSLSEGPVGFRRILKRTFLLLPFKPLVYFIYGYIIRFGFLDGYPGLCYNICKSIYSYQIGLKLHELNLSSKKTRG